MADRRRQTDAQRDRIVRQIERESERERMQRERADRQAEQDGYLRSRQEEAAARTTEAEAAREVLDTLLVRSLAGAVAPLDLDALRPAVADVPLHLGADAGAADPPAWATFEPAPPGAVGRMLGGQARHERAVAEARVRFAGAVAEWDAAEAGRRRRVAAARARHAERSAVEEERVVVANAAIDRMASGVVGRDRHAVSAYYQHVIDTITDPQDFPTARRAAYVPESSMLVVEWDLPAVGVVPAAADHRYVKARDAIDERPVPIAQRRACYQRLIAQIALRALRLAFGADPHGLVETVVVNGMIDDIDPATGQDVRRCLITLRATTDQFAPLVLERVRPVDCVRKHFAAQVSEHPDELAAVTPVLEFDMADPRVVDPVDVLSGIDARPNLLDLTGTQFEQFVQNLFTRMGFQMVQLYRAGGDGGIDCVVYDPRPVFGGKFCVQAKRYAGTVPPSAVRDLYGAVQHEGATKGLLITTGGYSKATYAWASNKPLQLITGTELLGICRQHGIPARILSPRP